MGAPARGSGAETKSSEMLLALREGSFFADIPFFNLIFPLSYKEIDELMSVTPRKQISKTKYMAHVLTYG